MLRNTYDRQDAKKSIDARQAPTRIDRNEREDANPGEKRIGGITGLVGMNPPTKLVTTLW